jgi:hypothetical protein
VAQLRSQHAELADPPGLGTLVSSSPRLTDLCIPLKRSRGDSAGVAQYRFLGSHLHHVRRLSLWLNYSPPHHTVVTDLSERDTPLRKPYPTGPGWPAVGAALNGDRDRYAHRECCVNRYRNGHVYNVLINSALDEVLARKIFAAMGAGKLEMLMVRACGGVNYPQAGSSPHFGLPRGAGPAGTMLAPFLGAVQKQRMVRRMNGGLVVNEMDVAGLCARRYLIRSESGRGICITP